MSRTLLDRTDGLLPVEGILRRFLTFYIATARETNELRVDIVEQLCQVWAQTILTILESRREEAYHIELDSALAICHEGKLSLSIVGVGSQLGGIFGPLLAYLATNGSLGIHLVALLIDELCLEVALIATLCPEREFVGSALYGIDSPKALIDERGCSLRSGGDSQLESLALCGVE